MIDAARRLGSDVMRLVEQRQFFVIHAARQSGKTTLLQELTRQLNKGDEYRALYCTLEKAREIPEPEVGIPVIVNSIGEALTLQGFSDVDVFTCAAKATDVRNAIDSAFARYCRKLDKPLVVFFDETDSLCGQTLISFLSQLRSGYVNRDIAPFIHSLALVGMKNIRDYRREYRDESKTLGSGSPFNIISDSMTLRNFTRNEVGELYAQHTDDTGQVFLPDAVDLVWEQSQGQPWIVNAIAREIVTNITKDEPLATITSDMVKAAIHTLVLRRDTHFDSLLARLKEERVRKVIEPILTGEMGKIDSNSDDFSYVKDIGLIRTDIGIQPANPIYGEIMVRSLNYDTQLDLEKSYPSYTLPKYLQNGRIDMECLLNDFQSFWRENSAIWRNKYEYAEAAPHLILLAFLQRVLNGGGNMRRDFAAGTGRTDLCVEYEGLRYPIELKLRYGDKTKTDGLIQIAGYMGTLGCAEGWLIIFDRRVTVSWDEKIFTEKHNVDGKAVTVYGC
jgi:hypothetical protein